MVSKELANDLTSRPGGERVSWPLPEPLYFSPEQEVFLIFEGSWTDDGEAHVRVFGTQGYSGPHTRWMFNTPTSDWIEHPGDTLFFEFHGHHADETAMFANPDTSVVVADRIINPANLKAHLSPGE
jgi:hypothetical protein